MAANNISFSVKSEGWPDVSDVRIGNMTDPTGIDFWYKVDANPWVWVNSGNNVNKFGLVMNYYDGQSHQTRTAFHVLVVNPGSMSGDVNVDIVLKPCTIDKNNVIQAITTITGTPGIEVNKVPGEASCTFG